MNELIFDQVQSGIELFVDFFGSDDFAEELAVEDEKVERGGQVDQQFIVDLDVFPDFNREPSVIKGGYTGDIVNILNMECSKLL